MNEGGWWMVFTAFCLASLVVVLEVEGIVNLYGDSDSNSSDDDQIENIPTDGIVCKINSATTKKRLGVNSKCPNWALAMK